jgi:2-amino-4-hydroxy-6-hydroxymethyldihydropteridine diphosphokinase
VEKATVYLALGSNLGDRERYLQSAIEGLARRGVRTVRSASIYLTAPRDVLDQPWFLNTVIEGNTSLDPARLLQACRAVEEENQRQRIVDKGPRTLDIDIIFYGSEIVREAALVIPHPHFSERRFVLEPLAEIAPAFMDPVSGKTVGQLLDACPDMAEVRRYSN